MSRSNSASDIDSIRTAFVGSIPETYDTCLGPLLFEVPAADLAARVAGRVPSNAQILEVACGTGISTRHLSKALPDAQITATDLNQAMIDFAIQHHGVGPGVCYEQADALALSYEDNQFDAVVCQFGIMFFPDKLKGLEEMRRVLKPGGLLVFNVWDSLRVNRFAAFALETIGEFFEDDPPSFLEVPFGFYDTDVIKALMVDVGLVKVTMDIVSAQIQLADSMTPARGLIAGNPTIVEIRDRATTDEETVIAALAKTLASAYGPEIIRIPIQEIVFTAQK